MDVIIRAIVAGAGLAALAFQSTAQEGATNIENKIVINQSANLSVYLTGPKSTHNVVFLHGDNAAATQWFAVMEDLADIHSVTVFDQRGHGSSSPATSGGYDYEIRADDLQAVVASLGPQPVILVAHSGSAGVALEYAKTHAASLSGIYFLDPASDPRAMPDDMRQGVMDAIRSENGLGIVQGYFTSIAGQNPKTIEIVTNDAAKVVRDARIGVAQALFDWNPDIAMSHWAGPTFMAITSVNDTPAAIRLLSETVEYNILSTEGHWPHLDTPEIVAQSIRSFIDSLS
ncbi:alpha/beta fold hydrolase [Parasedimentitalea huanghaiensis]|uniref:Alpha/beta fold hydrolase n=1 Tax=Parasedimentitalea huanghaiensis TaxID=2682100 RepID=A0A6L6WN32_9RHOB|nr:alpha/beta hydrolase [Zongyanglinia huanghaiensis]MVO18690.1 alpha/beta fold hydrolase [Zongyanglinia huanghaiensis]